MMKVNRKDNIQYQKTPISTKVPKASSRQTCQKVRFCLFVEHIGKKNTTWLNEKL